MTNRVSSPVPLDPLSEDSQPRRLWIGNLDPRITDVFFFCYWFALLKLLQQHGAIEKFDLLYHKCGPLEGKPRGYAFVTYSTSNSANSALKNLHGKPFGNKTLSVKWARSIMKDRFQETKPIIKFPTLAESRNKKRLSKLSTIQAIEAKLKTMEKTALQDFEMFNKPGSSTTELHGLQKKDQAMVHKNK